MVVIIDGVINSFWCSEFGDFLYPTCVNLFEVSAVVRK